MRLRQLGELIQPRELALRWQPCPLCGGPVLLRLRRHEHGVRCLRCRAAPAHMALGACIRAAYSRLAGLDVYEMSSRGPLCGMLRREAAHLEVSEYFDGAAPGSFVDGIRCEDVQALSFADARFDLCTSTDVFEHVADDRAGFRELCRVLKPGGRALFTVPLRLAGPTVERAELRGGHVIHHLPPEYHDDLLRGRGRVLAFRTYGHDIVDRLRESGFADARIDRSGEERYFGFGRAVVTATR